MFFLLENNRIIDSEISYTTNFPYWEVKDNRLYAKSKNNKIVRPYNENEIKKQSENVLDLTEVGDMVKTITDSIYQVVKVEKNTLIAPQSNNIIKCSKGFAEYWIFDLAEIKVIYKPDANGNYIKVWEVKENE